MKILLCAASMLLATSAHAQDSDAPTSSEVAQPTQDAAQANAAKLTIDSPIADLMADERTKAIVEAQMPGIEAHPAYSQVKTMSLKQVQPFSGGEITDEMIAAIAAGLAKIG